MHWPLPFLVTLAAAIAFAPTRLAVAAPPDQPKAADTYKTHCAVCHTPTGDSPIAMMNFADSEWKYGSRLKEIVKVIADGVPSSAMMPFKEKLSDAEILNLAKYVRAFDKRLK